MTTSNIPINHFDRQKPFYPLVMNYLILLTGVKELSLRGMLNLTAKELSRTGLLQVEQVHQLQYELSSKMLDAIGPVPSDAMLSDLLEQYTAKISQSGGVSPHPPSLANGFREIEAGLRKLAGPLQLGSKIQGTPIEVPPDLIADEITDNNLYFLSFTMRSAGSLLILAFETTRPYHDNGPLWEFLRHCRNAAAHNGRFRFNSGEPRRPAEWGNLRLQASMHDEPLFRVDQQTPGLVEPGDVIRLLWDIEQTYPNMQASS